jgi:phosphomevalonate kinase
MRVVASAPGKLVLLGEYAVLCGAPSLVVAVDRRCLAQIEPSPDDNCHIEVCLSQSQQRTFPSTGFSGFELVDLVTGSDDQLEHPPWRARLDSSEFFSGETKLGLGSSASALTVWTGAWASYTGQRAPEADASSLQVLIALHREFQGGAGSGLDIAASLIGGALIYQLGPGGVPDICSVALPNSVGFTGIFTGRAASTRDLVVAFSEWRSARPIEAEQHLQVLSQIAEDGCSAVRENDAGGFLVALASYGQRLEKLGEDIGSDIVSREHQEIARQANRFDVVYKVSGAGGGDLGVAVSRDPEAMAAFRASIGENYLVVDLDQSKTGLTVKEQPD